MIQSDVEAVKEGEGRTKDVGEVRKEGMMKSEGGMKRGGRK